MKASYLLTPKVPKVTFLEFCGLHNLSIRVHERDADTRAWGRKNRTNARWRFFVYVEGALEVEVAENSESYCGISPDGNRDTVSAALKDLARQLSGTTIQVSSTRTLIKVPKMGGR